MCVTFKFFFTKFRAFLQWRHLKSQGEILPYWKKVLQKNSKFGLRIPNLENFGAELKC